ncbi:hypothetical protein CCAX7_41350 [Capsulimonas corticalis]|uniref:Uncharacterized protein n=1 Tax=Capsulimonas corticalis TaxID=2219043 RepID=A0A402D765_9BACT|nr:hypothetical protein [Capsulimonas corticalis]BDI32084.1 hypothetical protein CCAX7_41350 [Capsulimonas corticalis]
MKITLSDSGMGSLQYHGDELLSDGALSVQHVTLSGAGGQSRDGDLKPLASKIDPSTRKIKNTYSWGAVSCAYEVKADRLSLTIGVLNTSPATISGIWIQPLALKFPQAPKDWTPNAVYMGANLGAPTISYANYGSGAVAVCNEDFARPLLMGFPGRADLQTRPIWVCSSNIGWMSQQLDSRIVRPIAPGGYDLYHISLRFGAPAATQKSLTADLLKKFEATYPPTLQWKDRRPIGTLHLAVSEPQYHSASNPRGWLMEPTMDVVSERGRAAFRKRIMDYADESVKFLQEMNAQGMVTWDIEGEEYPQATTYIGDPRLTKTLAPEMDAIADEYFKKFTDAGLKTGLCVRPQILRHTAAATEQTEISDPAKVVGVLYDKMVYAHKRWGCTLFYVDSNGDPNVPYDPAIFHNVAVKLKKSGISALIMPEHQNTRYYADTAPYDELRLGVTTTPADIRDVYPGAFSAIYAPDGPLDKDHDALVAAVKRGDILMFRGWWADPQNPQISKIYQDAGR